MREYMNKLTDATIVVSDNVTIAGDNWEEKQCEEEIQQDAEVEDETEVPEKKVMKKK